MSQEQLELLQSIDAKIGALLAVAVDQYLRDTDMAKPRHLSVDSMLRSVGLGAKDIAALLGKTEQAVYMMWKSDEEKKAKGKSRKKAKKDGGS